MLQILWRFSEKSSGDHIYDMSVKKSFFQKKMSTFWPDFRYLDLKKKEIRKKIMEVRKLKNFPERFQVSEINNCWFGMSDRKNFKNITVIKNLVNTCWPNCIKLQSYCFQNTWLLLQISLNGRYIIFFSVSWNCFFFEYFLLRFDSSN